MSRYLLFLLTVSSLTGCGVIFQTIGGWSDESQREAEREHQIKVTTNPIGSKVYRLDRKNSEKSIDLGLAPVNDTVTYTAKETISEPSSMLPLYIGTVLDIGALAAMFVGIQSMDEDSIKTLLTVYWAIFTIPIPLTELIAGFVYGSEDPEVDRYEPLAGGTSYIYRAEHEAHKSVTKSVDAPWSGALKLDLVAGIAKTEKAQLTEGVVQGERKPISEKVLAVMAVQDSNADNAELAVDPSLLRNIGDQLRIFIAQQGFRTIDRGAQERAFKDQVTEAKQESYKQCYDQSCQIDLGKALAAGYILRARITRFGTKCVLNAELIELRTEVAVGAASSTGACEPEGFLNMSQDCAVQIGKSAR